MSMFNPAESLTMQCKVCKKYVPKSEVYSDFYYCKYCDESFDIEELRTQIQDIEDAEFSY